MEIIKFRVDLIDFIFNNLEKLGVGDNLSFAIFIALSFLIGTISLTWRYVLDYRDKQEKKEWASENLLNKVILFLLVGLSSYLFIAIIRAILFKMAAGTQPPIFNFTWVIIAIIYTIFSFGNIKFKSNKAIKAFLGITWLSSFLLIVLLFLLIIFSYPFLKWFIFIMFIIIIFFAIRQEYNKL